MAKKREFETELPELPKITPIDESIHILEETVAVLQLKIAQLKARREPVFRKTEKFIRHPITGREANGYIKRKNRR